MKLETVFVVNSILVLGLLHFTSSSSYSQWQVDLNNTNCKTCMITRNYFCQKNVKCHRVWYKENIYHPFVEDCFGKDQLNKETVDEFLLLLKSGDPEWLNLLEKLLGVVEGLGYWRNSFFVTKTMCADLSPSSMQAYTIEDEKNGQNFKIEVLGNISLSQLFSYCLFSSKTYSCPINNSMIWRERFRLCQHHNESTLKCDCGDKLKIETLNYSCALVLPGKDAAQKNTCSCLENESLGPPFWNSTFKNQSEAIVSQKTTMITTVQFSIETDSNSNWKIIAILLCICVMLLFASIFFYVCWKICKPSRHSKEDANAMHATDTSVGTNNPSVFSNRPQTLPESRYFCIEDANGSLYHTIEPTFRTRGNNTRSQSVAPPPLPNRMFSLTSTSDESTPPRNWPQVPSPPTRPTATLTLGRHGHHCRNVDRLNAELEPEQPYEIPIPEGLPLVKLGMRRRGNEYESEISDSLENDDDDEVRFNPLYSTSEDEL